MSDEDRGDTVTHADLEELANGLRELRDAFDDLHQASTPQERRKAQGDVDDAEEDLDTTARRLGVSRAKLEESIQAARKAERKEELREPLRELLDELKAENDNGDDGNGDDGPKVKPKAKPKPKPAASNDDSDDDDGDDGPQVDDPPVREHWSEKGVAGMLR